MSVATSGPVDLVGGAGGATGSKDCIPGMAGSCRRGRARRERAMPAIVVPGKENAGSFLRVPLLEPGADQKNGRQSVQDCIPTLERGNDLEVAG